MPLNVIVFSWYLSISEPEHHMHQHPGFGRVCFCACVHLRTHVASVVMSSSKERRVERAKSRLEDAFEKSKSYFLEEANSIFRNTIDQSPGTSAGTRWRTPLGGGTFGTP